MERGDVARLFYSMVRTIAVGMVCALAASNSARAINISFNYQFDDQNFFASQLRRDALEAAANVFRVFTDSLSAISPGNVYNQGTPQEFRDTWTAKFDHPALGSEQTVTDLAIPANTVIIYAGGRNLAGNQLGEGGPGGFSAGGIASFVNAVSTRGQLNTTGSTPTDFSLWGGSITFDTLTSSGQARVWHTDLDTLPAVGTVDLYSVALHELGHLFGFIVIPPPDPPVSFQTYLNTVNHRFSGPKVVEVHGTYALTATDGSAHWHPNEMSTTTTGSSQLAVMGAAIPNGVRRFFTLLDYAAIKDIGWQVPESIFDLPIPGDYNGNGIVNAADYAVWRQNFGSTSSLAADGNQSGRVDAADYVIWRDHLGASGGSGSVVTLVPEPSGVLEILFFASFLRLLAARRCS